MLGMLQFGYNTGVINAPEKVSSPQGRLGESKDFISRFHNIVLYYLHPGQSLKCEIFDLQDIETFIKDTYKHRYNEDLPESTIRGMYSFAVSIFAVGGMLGGFSGGMIADRFGRSVRAMLYSLRECSLNNDVTKNLCIVFAGKAVCY